MEIPRSLCVILTRGGKFVEKWQYKGKRFELLRVVDCGKVKGWGKLVEDKGTPIGFVYADLSWCVSTDESCLLLLVLQRREGTPPQRDIYTIIRQIGAGRGLFLHFPFLNCLQLKVHTLKWYISGWHILIPIVSLSEKMLSQAEPH